MLWYNVHSLINLKWALNLYRHAFVHWNLFLNVSAELCTQFCRKIVSTVWHMCRNKTAIFQFRLFFLFCVLNHVFFFEKFYFLPKILISNISHSHIHKNFIDIHDLARYCNRSQCRKEKKEKAKRKRRASFILKCHPYLFILAE